MAELRKARRKRGRNPDLYFWRHNTGTEVDAVFEEGWRKRISAVGAQDRRDRREGDS